MILSAMMFALGAFVSGLAWLVITVALVRRARRLTERRLLASVSTRRVEFETERDELRARHAMQMHRLEKEVSRGLDMATAYRLEADIKERDLVSARTELAAREDDYQELQARLAVERDLVQDLERRHAEAGTMLRAVQHALTLEVSRRSQIQSALGEATAVADRRRLELSAVRAQNEALRAIIGDKLPADGTAAAALVPIEPELPLESTGRAAAPILRVLPESQHAAQAAPVVETHAETAEFAEPPPQGGSVVPLPTRHRPLSPDVAEQSAALVAEAARDLQRIAGEGHGDFGKGVWRAPAHAEPRMPVANAGGEASVVADLDARRNAAPGGNGAAAPLPQDNEDEREAAELNPDARFFEALAEIRALRRAAKQAGE